MLYFIDMSQVEQGIRLRKEIPCVDEYWRYRLGTSAVRVTLGLIESVSPVFSLML